MMHTGNSKSDKEQDQQSEGRNQSQYEKYP